MRIFSNLPEAESEIRRDIYKGTKVSSSRVQQRDGLNLAGRERLGYEYSILEPSHLDVDEIIAFGRERGFKMFQDDNIKLWLHAEASQRLESEYFQVRPSHHFTERLHPGLKQTFEGNSPSYTYQERLEGALAHQVAELTLHPDSRRAYWPIYEQHDARRMDMPTRIPCSLGYQLMIRAVGNELKLIMFYLERSCDFDTFWLSDVWLALTYQYEAWIRLRREYTNLKMGHFVHFIISFHSFNVEDQEIY